MFDDVGELLLWWLLFGMTVFLVVLKTGVVSPVGVHDGNFTDNKFMFSLG